MTEPTSMDQTSVRVANALYETWRQQKNTISIDEEVRERSNVTPEEVAEIGADVCGSPPPAGRFSAHRPPVDDANQKALLKERLRALRSELELMPAAEKSSLLEASRIDPALVDDDHRRLFLLADDMDAKRAAKRMAQYWQKRREIFGSEKFHLPLTLDGALRDDQAAWAQEFCQLLPSKDKFGRAILFFDPSRLDGSKCSPDSLLRVLWYIHHVAINDPEVHGCDVVVIVYEKNTAVSSFSFGANRDFNRRFSEINYHFPVKVCAVHICHPNWLVFVMLPMIKFFLGKRVRLRVIVHGGSEAKVLEDLSHYALTPDLLPIQMGGDVVLNVEGWVRSRLVVETPKASSQRVSGDAIQPSSSRGSAITKVTRAGSRVRHRQNSHHYGRAGDSRMNAAVEAKQENPKMKHLDALLVGGFSFPKLGHPYMNDKDIYDEDGISLAQRKNQLRRRLRAMEEKGTLRQSLTGDVEKT